MSTEEEVRDPEGRPDEASSTATTEAAPAEPEAKRKLDLRVKISDAGPCRKHIAIEVPQEEVEHQFESTLKDLRRETLVPGFRPGRAPKSLVSKRYRKEVSGQVKSSLLMACMELLDSDYKLNPITQPTFDLDAIDLPDNGPMTFELDVEVQPDFELPKFKGLNLKRPIKEVTDRDVDAQLQSFLERYAQLVPKTGEGAKIGDFVTADLAFSKDGIVVNQAKELQFRIQPELRFQDGHVPDLAGALVGARPGDSREAKAQIGTSSADPALRGQTIDVIVQIHDLKQLRLPELDAEFLDSLGFDSKDELREALRGVVKRRAEFLQRQALRRQILDHLIREVPFDLPADLVARQERSTLRMLVEELRQSGLSEAQIRAREAELRANAHERTLRSLKEHFLLSRIADAEEVKVEDEDIEDEITTIAMRSDESPRRVRSRIEKEGLLEGLAQQILERKTIDRVLEHANIVDTGMTEETDVETVDEVASPPGAPAEQTEPKAEAEG